MGILFGLRRFWPDCKISLDKLSNWGYMLVVVRQYIGGKLSNEYMHNLWR